MELVGDNFVQRLYKKMFRENAQLFVSVLKNAQNSFCYSYILHFLKHMIQYHS